MAQYGRQFVGRPEGGVGRVEMVEAWRRDRNAEAWWERTRHISTSRTFPRTVEVHLATAARSSGLGPAGHDCDA